MKKKLKPKKQITICPKCRNSNFNIINDTSFLTGDKGWYHCNVCGFENAFFPTVDKDEVKGFKKELKSKFEDPTKASEQEELKTKHFVYMLLVPFSYLFSMILLLIRKILKRDF